MTNLLSGNVQVVNLYPGSIVWYAPEGFPDMQTDAEYVTTNIDGTLTLFKGWGFETISTEQIWRTVSSWRAESVELHDAECSQFDQANSGLIGS